MRKTIFKNLAILLFALVVQSGCDSDDGSSCLIPSNNIISENRQLEDFNSISLEGLGNIFLTQESPQMVRIETHENILPLLETRVTNQQLLIEFDECVDGQVEKLDIYISIPEIEGLNIAGIGDITGQNSFDLDDLEIFISGVGGLTLNGTANNIDINSSGVGNVHAFELTSNTCDINIMGSGNVETTATDVLNVTINGAGNVFYKGNPTITSNISGSGLVIDAN